MYEQNAKEIHVNQCLYIVIESVNLHKFYFDFLGLYFSLFLKIFRQSAPNMSGFSVI